MDEKSRILDELLIVQAQRKDSEAFEQLVIRWHKKLLYQSHIRTNDWEQSEDIVQDVWQWLISNLTKLKEVEKFGSWIRTIVDRRSIDWVRKQQRDRLKQNQSILNNGDYKIADIGTTDNTDTADDANEVKLTQLERAMSQLNPESKLVLVLYYSESNSIETISRVLNIPKGTVKSRLFHAREKLKKILKQKTNEG